MRLKELVWGKLAEVGYEVEHFSLHSFRAGGDTKAANAGLPDRLFKRHGRWKSESAKDVYVNYSLEDRLRVSKSLGL